MVTSVHVLLITQQPITKTPRTGRSRSTGRSEGSLALRSRCSRLRKRLYRERYILQKLTMCGCESAIQSRKMSAVPGAI